MEVAMLEPWLDKKALARHCRCSVRWLELRIEEGMPYTFLAGRIKFKVSRVEPWLEEHGHLEERNAA